MIWLKSAKIVGEFKKYVSGKKQRDSVSAALDVGIIELDLYF